MESITVYRNLLAGIAAAVFLHTIFCQASPVVVRREVACFGEVPTAVIPRDSVPNWQNPGDCFFAVTETQTAQCLWCEHPVVTVISNSTYCCAAYRHCAKEDPPMITCDGFVDTSKDYQELAVDLQVFQKNLSKTQEAAELNIEEVSAIVSALTELPALVAILNETVENVWMSLDNLTGNTTAPDGDQL